MTLFFTLLLLPGDSSEYVLLQKRKYECVKIYCDSMSVFISQKPFSGAEAMAFLKPKTSRAGKGMDNEI